MAGGLRPAAPDRMILGQPDISLGQDGGRPRACADTHS